tara:strand:- start:2507 stop:2824 length:318 start_codon:yes stop_codon:yes gene_type:complete
MSKLSIEEKKEYQRKYDAEKYWKNAEQHRRTKIVQKIKREGNLPTEASINKYSINFNEIMTIMEYLEKIDDKDKKLKINDKLLKRIKYINEKLLKDKENNIINGE